MNPTELANQAQRAAEHAMILAQQARDLAARTAPAVEGAATAAEPFLLLLTIFLLACFVGYYVVWNVTPRCFRSTARSSVCARRPGPWPRSLHTCDCRSASCGC